MSNPLTREWVRRVAPAGIPFLFSLVLSLSTLGSHVYWQDSGLYLVSVKELGILYPPGFVLYLLLCKLWSLVFFFLDFTRAVHLFSAVLAACAAGALGAASRDLLRNRGPLFRVSDGDSGAAADWAGAITGCLAASGFTFWFAGIYAKGYSLYYLVLALLLGRMIRADGSGSRRDRIVVSCLIGLAWAAHPSSAMLAFALVAFVLTQRRLLQWKELCACVGASAFLAIAPSLLLPLLASRQPALMLGDPEDAAEMLRYLLGTRFTSLPGAFGLESWRASSFGQYFWEDFLGIGLLFVTVGLVRLARLNRRLLVGIALWLVPYAAVTILFKLEGQHDCWFVAAWMPLYLAAAVGIQGLAAFLGRLALPTLAALGSIAMAWAVWVNHPLLDQRSYELAELYGKAHLQNLDPDSIVLLRADDAIATTLYLQRLKGFRKDVLVIVGPLLGQRSRASGLWYDRKLVRENPGLVLPDYGSAPSPATTTRESGALEAAAFINANAGCGRPIFSQVMPLKELLRPDLSMVPAGVLWKAVQRAGEQIERRYWEFPVDPENLRSQFRRARGIRVKLDPGGMTVRPEGYEERFMRLLLNARKRLAVALLRSGQHEASLKVLGSIERLDAEALEDGEYLYMTGFAFHGLGQWSKAEVAFSRILAIRAEPNYLAAAHFYLGEIMSAYGRFPEARDHYRAAISIPALDSELRKETEKRLAPQQR